MSSANVVQASEPQHLHLVIILATLIGLPTLGCELAAPQTTRQIRR
jgi:hypothetical protein